MRKFRKPVSSFGFRAPEDGQHGTKGRVARFRGSGHQRTPSPPSLGAVTAEFAVALPAVLLLLALLLAGAAAGVTQLRLEGAARAGARELARGSEEAVVAQTVRSLAGPKATAAISSGAGWSTVTVSDRAGGPVGKLVPWMLTASATARTEVTDRASATTRAEAIGWVGLEAAG